MYLRQRIINLLHQTKTKVINGPFYTYGLMQFISENADL